MQQAILIMGDQLSRLSYAEKNMFLFLEPTFTGDFGGITHPPFTFLKTKGNLSNSNVNIVSVSSGKLDIIGTVLAKSGTQGMRYAKEDAKFTLNPNPKDPPVWCKPGNFVDQSALESFFVNRHNESEKDAIRWIIKRDEYFDVINAIRVGNIDPILEPVPFYEDLGLYRIFGENIQWY